MIKFIVNFLADEFKNPFWMQGNMSNRPWPKRVTGKKAWKKRGKRPSK